MVSGSSMRGRGHLLNGIRVKHERKWALLLNGIRVKHERKWALLWNGIRVKHKRKRALVEWYQGQA